MAAAQFRGASLHGSGTNRSQRAFVALPAQNMKIGSLDVEKIAFFTPTGGEKDARTSDVDGLHDGALPASLHLPRRAFCCFGGPVIPETVGRGWIVADAKFGIGNRARLCRLIRRKAQNRIRPNSGINSRSMGPTERSTPKSR